MDERAGREPSGRVPRTVFLLGLTSLWEDVASDMLFPLLPAFLLTLGAGPRFLGLLEGAAEATASLLKLASGHIADRVRRKKPLVLSGYAIASVAHPLVALATAPWHVLVVRVADRVGKGIRTTPRDVLIASSARPGETAFAFGFHRAMDHAGAVIGPLLASLLIALGLGVRGVFLASAIPGFLAVACVFLVREPASGAPRNPPDPPAGATPAPGPVPGNRALPRRFKSYLGILALFSLGNASDAFLLLRAHTLGVQAAHIPLLWAALHVSKSLFTLAGGRAADRISRPHLIACGWIVYLATYLGLALARGPLQVLLLFLVYGLYYGLTEPAERALVKDLVPEAVRGRAYGSYNFVVGMSAIPAGLLAGSLWQSVGPGAALVTGGALAGAASVLLLLWARRASPALDGPGIARPGIPR